MVRSKRISKWLSGDCSVRLESYKDGSAVIAPCVRCAHPNSSAAIALGKTETHSASADHAGILFRRILHDADLPLSDKVIDSFRIPPVADPQRMLSENIADQPRFF